jgi:hypothetical protein
MSLLEVRGVWGPKATGPVGEPCQTTRSWGSRSCRRIPSGGWVSVELGGGTVLAPHATTGEERSQILELPTPFRNLRPLPPPRRPTSARRSAPRRRGRGGHPPCYQRGPSPLLSARAHTVGDGSLASCPVRDHRYRLRATEIEGSAYQALTISTEAKSARNRSRISIQRIIDRLANYSTCRPTGGVVAGCGRHAPSWRCRTPPWCTSVRTGSWSGRRRPTRTRGCGTP